MYDELYPCNLLPMIKETGDQRERKVSTEKLFLYIIELSLEHYNSCGIDELTLTAIT